MHFWKRKLIIYIKIKFQVSGRSFEAKLFPRATAHGERLWSNPSNDYEQAFERIAEHTDRLIKRGVYSDAIWVSYLLVFFTIIMKQGSIVIMPRSEFHPRYQSTRCEQFYPKLIIKNKVFYFMKFALRQYSQFGI